MSTTVSAPPDLRTVSLSRIVVVDGFNPRHDFGAAAHKRLVASIARHGILVPLRVRERGDDQFALVAGERRYRAAVDAGLIEAPVIVATVEQTDAALVHAVVENVARQDLGDIEEAGAYDQLRQSGMNVRAIAAACSVTQRRVRERLALLTLPAAVQRQIVAGTVPLKAAPPLVTLAAAHPELAVLAARHVLDTDGYPYNGYAWADLIEDPARVARGQDLDEPLPDGVYELRTPYPLDRFTLTDKAVRDRDKLARLRDVAVDTLVVRFARDEAAQAAALHALLPYHGVHGGLVVGQDVADQLAVDALAGDVRRARRAAASAPAGREPQGQASDEGGPTEAELKAARAAEREAEREQRRASRAYNETLAIEVVKAFWPLKLEQPIVALLAAVDLHGDLRSIAERGARYGYAGWSTETPGKGTAVKVDYLSGTELVAKAREHVDGARTPGQLAGRLVALLVMAALARQDVVAVSHRSFYELPECSDIPGAEHPAALIQKLAIERLPEHLTQELRATLAERERRAAEQAVAESRVKQQSARLAELTDAELEQLVDDASLAYGSFTADAWKVSGAVRQERERRAAATAADATTTDD